MNTLKLFNAVVKKPSEEEPFISEEGYVIEPGALWAKDRIIKWYTEQKLSGNELNKTFHKSWAKIKYTPRFVLFLEQICHYISTYGSDFKDEIYIPDEILNVPGVKLKYKVIKAYTKEEMREKCLDLLISGIALKEETINDVLSVLVDELDYEFTGNEGIRNKEAIIKIADTYGVLPKYVMEFFRYIIYRVTGQSLLIKNEEMIRTIKSTNFNPGPQFKSYGLENLAAIFNRYKPLFLAFKNKCPKVINRISKLSKTYHTPMVVNPLNQVTNTILRDNDEHWLDTATPYALFKALTACKSYGDGQDTFVYRIRNGKSWTTKGDASKRSIPVMNYGILIDYLIKRYPLHGLKVFFPKDIKYALPTSEKMYVGDIPTGTKFYGKKLAVGIYWKNEWGAHDLDLSGVNDFGKVGWNAEYSAHDGMLLYSGDITNAPNGAVEYLYARNGLQVPTLLLNNVFSGSDKSEYKIVIGKGSGITKDYMMNPNKLFVEIKTKSVQKQTMLGLFLPEGKRQSFVLLNFGTGNLNVSNTGERATNTKEALIQQWGKVISFKKLLKTLGAEIVEQKEEAHIDYSLDALEKDSFTKVFDPEYIKLIQEHEEKR